VELVALSVDEVADSKALAQKLSLSFPLLSDTDRKLVRAFGVYDPGNEIAWPAIFIVGPDGKITWLKFLDEYKTRPPVQELLDAIDKK
jgi:peroxiredoxin